MFAAIRCDTCCRSILSLAFDAASYSVSLDPDSVDTRAHVVADAQRIASQEMAALGGGGGWAQHA
jgi:hypothetical protein